MDKITVIQSKYEILNGRSGYFRISSGGRIGIIDAEGNCLVAPKYDDVLISPDDSPAEMFVCKHRDGSIGESAQLFDLIYPDGELVSANCEGDCIGFREELAVVKTRFGIHVRDENDHIKFFIDGTQLNGPSYNALYHDGMLRVTNSLGFYSYYVNRDGKKKSRTYMHASDFSDERAVASVERPWLMKYQYGALDANGFWAVNPKYDYMHSFSNKLAVVKKKGKYGYVNQMGRVEIPLVWDDAWDFGRDGHAFVKSSYPPSSCLIAKDGNVFLQLPNDCEYARSFSDGMLAAIRDKKWGFIGSDGSWVIPPQYDAVGDFSSGVAPVQQGKEWFFIDKNGETVLKIEGELHIAATGLAHTDRNIYNYGYILPCFKKRKEEFDI